MRILVVSPNLPYPPDDGGKIRVFNLIKNLSGYHEIYLICFVWQHTGEAKFVKELQKYCKVIPIFKKISFLEKISLKFKHALNVFSAIPWMVKFLENQEMHEKIAELDNSKSVDIVQLEYGYMAGYATAVKNAFTVVDQHNIEWVIKSQTAKTRKNILSKCYNAWESFRFRSWEKRASKNIDAYLTVSANDNKSILKYYGTKAEVIQNGVDTEYLRPCAKKEGNINLLFLGSMSWYPNEDGVMYFAKKIFPGITEKYNAIRFYIAGKNPGSNIKKLARDNRIIVTGYIEDSREYFQKNCILVVPLRIGGGTRFKILEAMSCGIPVVSTSLGCEGIEITGGKNIIVADEPGQFAKSVIELIENQPLQEKLKIEGRKLAQLHYDWQVIVKKLNQVYASAAGLK